MLKTYWKYSASKINPDPIGTLKNVWFFRQKTWFPRDSKHCLNLCLGFDIDIYIVLRNSSVFCIIIVWYIEIS